MGILETAQWKYIFFSSSLHLGIHQRVSKRYYLLSSGGCHECFTSWIFFSPSIWWAFCVWQKSTCWAWRYEIFTYVAISCLLFLHEITAEIIVLDMWYGVISPFPTKWRQKWIFMTSYTWMLFPKCPQDGSGKILWWHSPSCYHQNVKEMAADNNF